MPHYRNHSPSNGILSAGFQNKQPAMYKRGVQILYGIPYTLEEQNTVMSMEQIKNTILTLCREQRRHPDLFEWDRINNRCGEMVLPEANELIAWSVQGSPRIMHPTQHH